MMLEKIAKTIRKAGIGWVMLTAFAGCADSGSKKHSPQITSNPITEVYEGENYLYDVNATDKNKKDELIYSLTTDAEWLSIDSTTGLITGKAPEIDEDTFNKVVVQVCDRKRKCDVQDYDLNVMNLNHAPTITAIPTQNVNEGQEFSYRVNATDIDGNGLAYSFTANPAWLSIDPVTGLITGTAPLISSNATDTVNVHVDDSNGGTDTEVFDVTVMNVNQAPETTISNPDFGSGFNGEYFAEICAEDDSGIDYVELWTNGAYNKYMNAFNENPYCFNVTPQIIATDNSLEAIAVDDEGTESEIASRSFYSPTNENTEVRPVVDNLLIQRGYPEGPQNPVVPYFEKDSQFWINSVPIICDYAIKAPNGAITSIINLGYENRQGALDDMNMINQTSIPQDTYIAIPTDEVQARLNASLTNKGL